MASFNIKRDRRTLRLPNYDYSSPGAYFVTACTWHRELLFDTPEANQAVESAWHNLLDIFGGIELDEFVVMPNHIHGIIWILENGAHRLHPGTWKNTPGCRNEQHLIPTANHERKPITLGNIVGAFKTTAATRINKMHNQLGAVVWQKSYYEHIIRNDRELNKIREYIVYNLQKWEEDRDNPTNAMFGLPAKAGADYLKDIL